MNQKVDPGLIKIGQGFFGGQSLNGELSLDLSKKSFIVKLLSTPMVQSSILSVLGSTILLFVYWLTELSLFAYVGGLCIFLTIIYDLLIPIFRPDLTKSEINIMFFAYISLIEKTLDLPTSVDGMSLEKVYDTDQLAMPVLQLTDKVQASGKSRTKK